MGNRRKYPPLQLRNSRLEVIEFQESDERRIIRGNLDIDYRCFRKNSREKDALKLAKLQSKIDDLHN
jgi:hypothetical protein